MPFPESPRVIYHKNPLNQVICQLRFPTILRIDSSLPTGFQERIRDKYPILQERAGIPNLPVEIAQQTAPESGYKRVYDFVSEDEEWIVSLGSSFLALTARKYTRWEHFLEHLTIAFDALIAEYSPSFIIRIGLRYQNVIQKSVLGIDETIHWSELLTPYIAGELAAPEVENSVKERVTNVLIDLKDDLGQVRIQHGLFKIQDRDEICYLIDGDFFTERRTNKNDAFNTLEQFHGKSGQLFRWCINDRLHKAMDPEPIS